MLKKDPEGTRLQRWINACTANSDPKPDSFIATANQSYHELKQEAFTLPVNSTAIDLNKFNPLSKVTAGNPWTMQYENQNRLNEIKLDVDRTHQEIPFFQRDDVQKSMINVLYVFGKTHKLQYRQGMNEVCAVIFHTVCEGLDAATPLTDPSDVKESVAYAIFAGLMMKTGVIDFFFSESVLSPDASKVGGSPLLARCEKIFDLLAEKDGRLHKHLVMNDIAPNLFLVRWVRLLFAREFSFTNIIKVWDFIFEHLVPGERLLFPSVVDYLAIAMILNIRQSLLTSDNSGCFSILLKYPPIDDLDQLLDLTLRIMNGSLPLLSSAPVVAPAQATALQTKRDRVVTDLSSVISDLRNSEVAKSIQREIAKLEDVVSFLKPASGR